MNKQQAREQKRKAKKLARLLAHRDFKFEDSFSCPGDGVLGVAISLNWDGQLYQATGASKCNRVDVWNENLGVEIATGRALLRIAYQILKEEDYLIEEGSQALGEYGDSGIPFRSRSSIEKEVISLFGEWGIQGVIFLNEGSGPVSNPLSEVPGTRQYKETREKQVIQPEVVPTGLEVMREKGMLDAKEKPTPSAPES